MLALGSGFLPDVSSFGDQTLMTVAFKPDAPASTVSPTVPYNLPDSAPPIAHEQVRHLLFGSLGCVQGAIAHLHKLGYADPNDWSRPISTGRPNEVMAILTKRVR